MVENYGESVQDRAIPNPIRTFKEAFADFRKSPVSHLLDFLRKIVYSTIIHVTRVEQWKNLSPQ